MIYGFIIAATTTATLLCVTIHRRHLMVFRHSVFFLNFFTILLQLLHVTSRSNSCVYQVWGLFAPKFVFDVVGLMLTDVLICLASMYFLSQIKDDPVHDRRKVK